MTPTPEAEHAPWYQEAVIYQIPVGLFRDSTVNGMGDLRGVAEKLHHVKELGATAVWLQPFYRTPYLDGGYDVADHMDVSDRFGTLDDFDDLVARATELGLEVILDLVVQHTSVLHPWFRAACRHRDSRFRDYYIWSDEPHQTIVDPIFPSVEDSVWAWNDEAVQYYRHTFYGHEADLNVANAEVRNEIRTIMEFWLDRGVAGFRINAAPYIVAEAARVDGHNHTQVNAARQIGDPDSVFSYYRELIRLRHDKPAVAHGEFILDEPEHPQIFAFTRRHDGVELRVIANFSADVVDMTPALERVAEDASFLLGNVGEVRSGGSLQPWESRIYRRCAS